MGPKKKSRLKKAENLARNFGRPLPTASKKKELHEKKPSSTTASKKEELHEKKTSSEPEELKHSEEQYHVTYRNAERNKTTAEVVVPSSALDDDDETPIPEDDDTPLPELSFSTVSSEEGPEDVSFVSTSTADAEVPFTGRSKGAKRHVSFEEDLDMCESPLPGDQKTSTPRKRSKNASQSKHPGKPSASAPKRRKTEFLLDTSEGVYDSGSDSDVEMLLPIQERIRPPVRKIQKRPEIPKPFTHLREKVTDVRALEEVVLATDKIAFYEDSFEKLDEEQAGQAREVEHIIESDNPLFITLSNILPSPVGVDEDSSTDDDDDSEYSDHDESFEGSHVPTTEVALISSAEAKLLQDAHYPPKMEVKSDVSVEEHQLQEVYLPPKMETAVPISVETQLQKAHYLPKKETELDISIEEQHLQETHSSSEIETAPQISIKAQHLQEAQHLQKVHQSPEMKTEQLISAQAQHLQKTHHSQTMKTALPISSDTEQLQEAPHPSKMETALLISAEAQHPQETYHLHTMETALPISTDTEQFKALYPPQMETALYIEAHHLHEALHSSQMETALSVPAEEQQLDVNVGASTSMNSKGPVKESVPELNLSGSEKRRRETQQFHVVTCFTDEPCLYCDLRELNILLSSHLICKKCESNKVEIRLQDDKKCFLTKRMILFCKGLCNKKVGARMSSDFIKLPEYARGSIKSTRKSTLRFTFGALTIGFSKAERFISHLNIDSLSAAQYRRLVPQAAAIMKDKVKKNRKEIAELVRKAYMKMGIQPVDGYVHVAIGYDGSWMTKGHGSLIGIGLIIDAETGFVLDYHVSCKMCYICRTVGQKQTKENYDAWYEKHKNKCTANFDSERSSGSMEAESAVILFKRSLNHGLVYKKFIGDEDSSTFKRLNEADVYGDIDIKVQKINCLNHVCKKIYKRLDNIRKMYKLSSRGKGALTQMIINFFANIYRIACKTYFDDHAKLRQMIFSSIDHHAATDSNPTHDLCISRWCKYKKDIENGLQPGNGWHDDKQNRMYSITPTVAVYLKEVFQRLTEESVLDRVTGQTQNPNESLHSKIWNTLPKTGFRGKHTIDFNVAQTIIDHNNGVASASIHSDYGMAPGKALERYFVKVTKRREKVRIPKPRKINKSPKKGKNDYSAGGHAAEDLVKPRKINKSPKKE